MIFAINYDLKQQGQNYAGLYEAIKTCGDWYHLLGSTWLVDTTMTAEAIWKRLSTKVDGNDNVLVSRIGTDDNGWLPKAAWNWIAARR
jgi:hypothetical protein